MLDLPFLLCLAFLWTAATCAIAYLVGRSHGWGDGYLKGIKQGALPIYARWDLYAKNHAQARTIARLRMQGTLDVETIVDLKEQLERVTCERDAARGHLAGTVES